MITCKSVAEARAAVAAALRILKQLGVVLHPQKTRIVHVQHGFEFLGYKIKRGKALRLPASKIRSQVRSGRCMRIPERSRLVVSRIRCGSGPSVACPCALAS